MDELLRVSNLNKSYGLKKVLKDLNFTVEKGKIVGLLGPNGVGKTTLLKTIMGLINADSGKIYLEGNAITVADRDEISYLLEPNDYYNWMKVKDMIQWYVDFFPSFDTDKAKRLIEQFEINENMKFSKLSKGNQERVTLMLALSRRTKLYLFDEPIGGLDPKLKKNIIKIILDNIEEGSTAIISSHLLKDLENLFDDVLIMTPDKIIQANVDEIKEKYGMSLEDFYIENVE